MVFQETGLTSSASAGLVPFSLQVPEEIKALVQPLIGQKVVLGIRPEDIQISAQTSEGNFDAVVDRIERLGGEILLHASSWGHQLVARSARQNGVIANGKISVTFRIQHAHFFGPNNGNLLA